MTRDHHKLYWALLVAIVVTALVLG